MTAASDIYRALEVRLFLGCIDLSLSETEVDSILEDMDDAWWEMTSEERERANDRAADLIARLHALVVTEPES